MPEQSWLNTKIQPDNLLGLLGTPPVSKAREKRCHNSRDRLIQIVSVGVLFLSRDLIGDCSTHARLAGLKQTASLACKEVLDRIM